MRKQNREARSINLLLFALAVIEGLYLVGAIRVTDLFSIVGADFRALYAAAQIAREAGFSSAYDLERQAVVQTSLCQSVQTHAPCVLIPMVFPPIFLLPVIPLTALGPVPAFLLWSMLHILGTLAVLRPWVRSLASSERRQQLAMALLSFPSFASLFWGQSTLWLLLCVSAFLGNWIRRREFQAGLWASGLLLKPQTMVLLLPALAVARQWNTLAGALTGTAILFGLSLLLGGLSGIAAWGRTLGGFSTPVPSLASEVVGVETMMNWRSAGALMTRIIPPPAAWALAGGGMLLTIGAALLLASRAELQRPKNPERFTIGILAATLASTWHAHTHMALVLLPPLLSLRAQEAFPKRIWQLWALLPAWSFFAVIAIGVLPFLPSIAGLGNFLAGKVLFGVHLYFTVWALRQIEVERQAKTPLDGLPVHRKGV